MATINPYLNFNGNCEEAFTFYKSVFGGDYHMMMRFKEAPPEFQSSAEEGNKIMHVSFPVGDTAILMGSDTPSHMEKTKFGNNMSISISASSKEESDRLFTGLSKGGKVIMPMENAFWGSYFGMLTDPFDVNWMISFDQR
jgi:PhnB protein